MEWGLKDIAGKGMEERILCHAMKMKGNGRRGEEGMGRIEMGGGKALENAPSNFSLKFGPLLRYFNIYFSFFFNNYYLIFNFIYPIIKFT